MMKLLRYIVSKRGIGGLEDSGGAGRRLRIVNRTRGTVMAASVEIADTGTRRTKGLLGREHLGAGEGLWIVPCEAIHTFGMQFPIDLVYLDRRYRVVKVCSAVASSRVSVCLSARSVLELGVGTVLASQTQAGDCLEVEFL